MFSVFNIAAGGLNAASARLSITAGNIANMGSSGYKARQANLTASPNGVAVTSISTNPTPGPIDENGQEGSNVDPVKESVGLLMEKHQYAANAQVIKAGNRMIGSLLDILAK